MCLYSRQFMGYTFPQGILPQGGVFAVTQKKEKRTFFGWLKWAGNRYFIRAMSSMALGLFSSLIIGLIL